MILKPENAAEFALWNAKLAEAYCVEARLACNRKFTDAELEPAREEVRKAMRAADYADAMIYRDRLERPTWRDDHDQTTRGGSLKDAA